MSYEIIWSRRSTAELREIQRYIANHNPTAAVELVTEIIERVNRLSDQPLTGGLVRSHDAHQARQVIIGRYRVIY